jgi:hypothetical protein
MSPYFANWDERTIDLAVQRFTVGLDQNDEAALDRMVECTDLDEFESVVAAIHLAHLTDIESPPAELVVRMEHAGHQHLVRGELSTPTEQGGAIPFTSRVVAYGGWLAAAILLVMFTFVGRGVELDAVARRDALIADAGDLINVDWSPTEDAAAEGAGGDVVWSTSLQEGYMRFENLAPNDPEQNQYQLWIFDKTRADWEEQPIDGGVFDVPPSGIAVVPIDPKLAVGEAALFAVTMEVPGGVVVSKRERLVLTATP